MRIMIVGSGYVGLVSGACFAELGHDVICIDNDQARLRLLAAGRMPIFERGLAEMVARNVAAGRLAFEAGMGSLDDGIDAVFIAVGTPARANDQRPDLSSVLAVAQEIAAKAGRRIVVVTKSTVPPGTGDAIERVIREARPDLELAVVSNPEFLREGEALDDFMTPDRICVGTDDVRAREVMATIYRPLIERGIPIQYSSRRAAELVKYAANAFLAVKISFINEIANLCEAVGADIGEVAHGVGLDRRIGSAFLRAGPGYGGSCFPKDSFGLLATAEDNGVILRILASTIAVNLERRQAMAQRVIRALGGDVRGRTIAVLGLTFKPNTDDMRESPSIEIVRSLVEAGATICAYDPEGMDQARAVLPGIAYAEDVYACVSGADCVVLATEWPAFQALDPRDLAAFVRCKTLVDLRNALDAPSFAAAGFAVHGIGRPTLLPAGATARTGRTAANVNVPPLAPAHASPSLLMAAI